MGFYFISSRAQEILGIDNTTPEFYSRFVEQVHPADRQPFLDSVREAVSVGSPWNFEGRLVKSSGETIWFAGMSRPVHHEKELVYTGVVLDITARKNAEEALRESEEMYRLIAENSPAMIYVVDIEGYVRYVNSLAASQFGGPPENIAGKQLSDIFPIPAAKQHLDAIRQVIHSKTPVHRETREEFPAGTRWIDVRLAPIIGPDGSVTAVFGLSNDITDRKQVEEALQDSEQQYTRLFEHANDGITIVQDGIIRKINTRFAEMLGYTADELSGQEIKIFVHPDDLPEVLDRHMRRLAGEMGLPSIYTFRSVTKQGGELWVELNTTVVDWQGRSATLNVIRDITDRKRMDDALRESNKKLNLLSSITRHDVLNKLTVLQGWISLSESIPEKDMTFKSLIERELKAVTQIQRIISFTREYEAIGVHSPEWQEVGIVAKQAAVALDLGRVSLDVRSSPCQVYADPLLQKVFYNLFDNSLRYGGEKISQIRITGVRDNGNLTIIVEDNGGGIDPEIKKHLFERGVGKNTGLGLFLAKEILGITKIAITEKGEPGKGARFVITVPKGMHRVPPGT
jgi:PAS domain S-box-containing protein